MNYKKSPFYKLHKAAMRFYRQLNVNQRINLKGNYEAECGHNDEVARMTLAGIDELYVVCCRQPKLWRGINNVIKPNTSWRIEL